MYGTSVRNFKRNFEKSQKNEKTAWYSESLP